jgi:hypothetical protein
MLPKHYNLDLEEKRGQVYEIVLKVYSFIKKKLQEARGEVFKHYKKHLLKAGKAVLLR